MNKVMCRISNVLVLLAAVLAFPCFAEDNASTNTAVGEQASATNESLRAYLHLQQQLHETLLAIERNRQLSEDATAKSASALEDRLRLIEDSLAAQRASEQRVNHTLLIVVSAFATLGCVAVLLTAYFQWQAVNRLTALSTRTPAGLSPAFLPALNALSPGQAGMGLPALGPATLPEDRLIGAIERLEKRIRELETPPPALNGGVIAASNIVDLKEDRGAPDSAGAGARETAASAASRLGKGQSLLNLGSFEEAIACFDEVLAADPANTEALVKKGTALERLRKTVEALDCYDRAIAVDSGLAIAYLYKGGLLNRMERFSEALECYEQALRSQEQKRRVS